MSSLRVEAKQSRQSRQTGLLRRQSISKTRVTALMAPRNDVSLHNLTYTISLARNSTLVIRKLKEQCDWSVRSHHALGARRSTKAELTKLSTGSPF
jgi:hypothetical protein